jgi:hypothetical protein
MVYRINEQIQVNKALSKTRLDIAIKLPHLAFFGVLINALEKQSYCRDISQKQRTTGRSPQQTQILAGS